MKKTKQQRKSRRSRKPQTKKLGRGFLRQNFPNVRHVVDATSGVQVEVSSRDSQEGQKNQPTECAMAKALRRDSHADGVVIGLSRSYVIKGDTAIRYMTPETVAREITSFDRHQDFAPGTYALAPMSPSQRQDAPRPGKPSSGSYPRRVVHKRTVRVRTLKT